MAVKTLNVSWNNFQNVAKDMFRQLKSDTDFTDVTLVSEDLVHIRAHKVILAASSDLFQAILRNTSSLLTPSPSIHTESESINYEYGPSSILSGSFVQIELRLDVITIIWPVLLLLQTRSNSVKFISI